MRRSSGIALEAPLRYWLSDQELMCALVLIYLAKTPRSATCNRDSSVSKPCDESLVRDHMKIPNLALTPIYGVGTQYV